MKSTHLAEAKPDVNVAVTVSVGLTPNLNVDIIPKSNY